MISPVADSGNGLSSELDITGWQFINPELTVHLHRMAVGEWICLDAATAISAGGAGLATPEGNRLRQSLPGQLGSERRLLVHDRVPLPAAGNQPRAVQRGQMLRHRAGSEAVPPGERAGGRRLHERFEQRGPGPAEQPGQRGGVMGPGGLPQLSDPAGRVDESRLR